MTVRELNREQLIQVKQSYLANLDDEGVLNEVIYGNPEWDSDGEHGLSMGELADADEIVPDDVIFHNYEGTYFTEDDFN